MLHQAANDGFRGLYLVCFDGPDAASGPRGLAILSNGDNRATLLNCAVAQKLLRSESGVFDPPLRGLDWGAVMDLSDFSMAGIKQEEIVNMGMHKCLLGAFMRPQRAGSSATSAAAVARASDEGERARKRPKTAAGAAGAADAADAGAGERGLRLSLHLYTTPSTSCSL
jgi:hypothetical protein